MVAIQNYGTNLIVHYLQTTFRNLRVPSSYEKMAKNSLWTWFTPKGKFQPYYLQAAKQGTTMKHLKQHLPILKEYPTLQNELVMML